MHHSYNAFHWIYSSSVAKATKNSADQVSEDPGEWRYTEYFLHTCSTVISFPSLGPSVQQGVEGVNGDLRPNFKNVRCK